MTFKKALLAVSLFSFGTLTPFVAACSCTAKSESLEQKIVNHINTFEYELPMIVDSTYNDAINRIIANFIKKDLPTELKDNFNDNAFSVIKITDARHNQLTDNHFKEEGDVIFAYLYYSYANYTNQIAMLDLPIINSDEQIIINEITNTNYEIDIEINTKYEDLITMIDADFIKTKLSSSAQEKFNPELFDVFDLLDSDWTILEDQDLINYAILEVKIDYVYNNVINELANLKIKILAKNENLISSEINNIDYTLDIDIKSTYSQLKDIINADFIKTKLSNDLQADFINTALNIKKITNNVDETLTDKDFENVNLINAKINFDYGSIKNQSTSLTINVQKYRLSEKLKEFHLKDWKGFVDFLEAADMTIVRAAIEAYLSIANFDAAGLIFEEQKSNSIIVKAKPESELFQGEITISWNLKIFEVWGAGVNENIDIDARNGYKGFFYLEKETNLIKYFDTYGPLTNNQRTSINTNFNNYHSVNFRNMNDQTKNFTINGRWYTNQVPSNFDSFDFTTSSRVTVNTPENNRLKGYNWANKRWSNTQNKTYIITNLGAITGA